MRLLLLFQSSMVPQRNSTISHLLVVSLLSCFLFVTICLISTTNAQSDETTESPDAYPTFETAKPGEWYYGPNGEWWQKPLDSPEVDGTTESPDAYPTFETAKPGEWYYGPNGEWWQKPFESPEESTPPPKPPQIEVTPPTTKAPDIDEIQPTTRKPTIEDPIDTVPSGIEAPPATRAPNVSISSSTTRAPTNLTHINKNQIITRAPVARKEDGIEQAKPAPSKANSLLATTSVAHFEARDVTYFLESHLAHSIHDPRAYFTEERTTRSLAIMSNELSKLQSKLRFAYMVRVFNELGRKIVSKLNYYTTEVAAILRKAPDDLGNKPEVSQLVDAIKSAFESKEDHDPREENDEQNSIENPISQLIDSDQEKAAVFNASLKETSARFAQLMSYFVLRATKYSISILANRKASMVTQLSEAVQMGAKAFIDELSKSDKFHVPDEIVGYLNEILSDSQTIFRGYIQRGNLKIGDSIRASFTATDAKSFKDLNPISDRTGLIGPWNNYLFSNLGSSERVLKLFSSLLSRVPPEAKSKWINMYISQVNTELERTLSGFVIMQGMPCNMNMSQNFLLDPARSVQIMPAKLPAPRENYLDDKNRIPARCYLAGRRWRVVLTRALKGYDKRDTVINGFADKIGQFKVNTVKKTGNDIYRLCLPRLEVGLRGWGINGDPEANGGQTNKFPMKNPIEGLNAMPDPFVSGARLGYTIGAKVGFNEERNATLEMEMAGNSNKIMGQRNSTEQTKFELTYLARASYRHAATVAAKRAFAIGVREGYLSSLKISLRAGMHIPSEAGSKMAALKCVDVAGQTGMEAGRSVAESYITKQEMPETLRTETLKVGETSGSLAGEHIGETIGAIVGKEAAEEAYKRGIIRGGKVARAKFHLDEYEAGAKLGFDLGLKEGKRIASSSSLDPSAPKFFILRKPIFSSKDKGDTEVDHWEKDLIPPLSDGALADLQRARNHTTVYGSLRGFYRVAKETKKGFNRVSYANLTYNLEVNAEGFIMNNVAYLTLNGTVNRFGPLRGSLIARDIFNDNKN